MALTFCQLREKAPSVWDKHDIEIHSGLCNISTASKVSIACLKRYCYNAHSSDRPQTRAFSATAVYESVEYERATVNPVLEVGETSELMS